MTSVPTKIEPAPEENTAPAAALPSAAVRARAARHAAVELLIAGHQAEFNTLVAAQREQRGLDPDPTAPARAAAARQVAKIKARFPDLIV